MWSPAWDLLSFRPPRVPILVPHTGLLSRGMVSRSYRISSGHGVRNFSSCSAVIPKPEAHSFAGGLAFCRGSPGGPGYRRLEGFSSQSLCALGAPRMQ